MRPVLFGMIGLVAWMGGGGWSRADPSSVRPPDAGLPWISRVGGFLGPQYYLQHDDRVQFSFGAEGHLRLEGPLALGIALRTGVIQDSSVSGQAGLRLHLLRVNRLRLGLDLRGGALVLLFGDAPRAEPLLSGGFELVHDLGTRFYILFRAGVGWVAGEDRGALADVAVGLGFFL